jgi:hypothetical protein
MTKQSMRLPASSDLAGRLLRAAATAVEDSTHERAQLHL